MDVKSSKAFQSKKPPEKKVKRAQPHTIQSAHPDSTAKSTELQEIELCSMQGYDRFCSTTAKVGSKQAEVRNVQFDSNTNSPSLSSQHSPFLPDAQNPVTNSTKSPKRCNLESQIGASKCYLLLTL